MSKNISTYFKDIKNFKKKLDSRGIVTSTAKMATTAVARVNDSNYFTEEKMIDWEIKSDADQASMAIV